MHHSFPMARHGVVEVVEVTSAEVGAAVVAVLVAVHPWPPWVTLLMKGVTVPTSECNAI